MNTIEDKIKKWSTTKEEEFNVVIKFYPERIRKGVSLNSKRFMLSLGYNEGIFTMEPDYFVERETPEERALYTYYEYPNNPNKFILLDRGGQPLTGYRDTLEEAINELFNE